MPDDEASGASRATRPIDAEVLRRIVGRLETSARFSTVVFRPESDPNAVVADYDTGYFPAAVDRAYLRIRWFETDDFSVHYSEQYEDGTKWECRWDRHPNDHNSRAHFHPPPDAVTPGRNATYPVDWRDVLTRVLDELD